MFFAWFFTSLTPAYSRNPESITVAYSPFESTALLWVAEDRHFFEKNGLNLSLRKYDSGAASLDGVVNEEADMTVGVTEFPLVRKALQNVKVSAIGTVDKDTVKGQDPLHSQACFGLLSARSSHHASHRVR